jgi:hypothetical protein
MAEAGWFGVAVTVAPAVAVSPRGARLSDMLRPAGMADAGLVGELHALADARSRFVAYEAVVVAQLAARRPVETDLAADRPGHRVEGWSPGRVPVGVSEFFADELAVVKGISVAAAVSLGERSLVLVHQLPVVWGALADGLLDEPRANAIVRALGGQSVAAGGQVDAAVVGEVEAQAVAWALAGGDPAAVAGSGGGGADRGR